MVATMRPGAVIVDCAIDQGGCIEIHERPTPIRSTSAHGVLHYAVGNVPGAVPHTSTYALTNATLPYAVALATLGPAAAVAADPALAAGSTPSRPGDEPGGGQCVGAGAVRGRRASRGARRGVLIASPARRTPLLVIRSVKRVARASSQEPTMKPGAATVTSASRRQAVDDRRQRSRFGRLASDMEQHDAARCRAVQAAGRDSRRRIPFQPSESTVHNRTYR